MPDKSLARQVFPPGAVGDLIYKVSQMIPMNAFAPRQMQQPQMQVPGQLPPQQAQMPQQMPMNQGPIRPQGGAVYGGQMPLQQPQQLPPAQNAFALRNVRY